MGSFGSERTAFCLFQFSMLNSVYTLLKGVVEASDGAATHENEEEPIALPSSLWGYAAWVQRDGDTGAKKIRIKTEEGDEFAVVWVREELSYELRNGSGEVYEKGIFALDRPPTSEEAADLSEDEYAYSFRVHTCEEMRTLSSSVMVLELDGSGAMDSMTKLDFHLFPSLRSVTISDHSFRNVKRLSFSSLRFLETIAIGSNCFTMTEDMISFTADRELHVCGCNALQSIEIGNYSLSECSVLAIRDAPCLESLHFGSFTFFNCPVFVLNGSETVTCFRRLAVAVVGGAGGVRLLQRASDGAAKWYPLRSAT